MLIVATFVAVAPSFAQNQPASPAVASSGQPDSAEMMKQMMELAKLNEITSSSPIWPARGITPSNFGQRTVHGAGIQRHRRQEIDNGRSPLYVMDVTGKMQMPGPDGKMKDMTFKGMGIEDYDNVKKKFDGT